MDEAFAAVQRLLPQHGLTRAVGWLGRATAPWIKLPLMRAFAAAYQVDLTEAARGELADYLSFNDFFTRELQPGARPLPDDERAICCPADGAISQSGRIEEGRMLQAKGWRYSLSGLAQELGEGFDGGQFATIYLAPRDYHRVHAPATGQLTDARAIPGALFSVNAATENAVKGLFCRNERLVCRLRTGFGDLLVVLVGALIVGSIATPWRGPQSPYRRTEAFKPDEPLERGAELGRFLLGSTVILCCPPKVCALDSLKAGQKVRMGMPIGRWT
ncbi:MAG: archaetidylserine decarboxylase [Gammaproteobacteria bacterium]|nr:archaetidylserine decarboxylase [Gammaproteobacteria bacterium]